MRKIITLVVTLILILALTACSGGAGTATSAVPTSQADNQTGEETITAVNEGSNSETPSSPTSVEYDSEDLDFNESSSAMTYITLGIDTITLEGSGASVDGNKVTITAAGTYSISGTLNDGQIIVNAGDQDTVKLVLNGANISSSTSSPIYIISGDKVVITLAEGTQNFVTDGSSYILENADSDEPNAAIFSKSDLTINGTGSLTVKANYKNGIVSKDDLIITGGNITVDAVNDGIKGRDMIAVKDGIVTINSGGDGMQSNNDEDATRGYVAIDGGTFNITAGMDGIQAATNLTISGGNINIKSGGGSSNSSSNTSVSGNTWGKWGAESNTTTTTDTSSAKGIKAGVALTITGGILKIDSSDDSIHSNNSIIVNGGNLSLTSGDDGIHADSSLEINDSEISITQSYEGIESAVITINGGNIHLTASDDGVNVAGGNDGSSINGRLGQNNFIDAGINFLYINGGYLVINAGGDGVDVNGSGYMTAGAVIVNGPTNNGNGPMDYLTEFKVTGGYLLAVGSSGMAQAPSTSSTQYSVMVNLSTSQSANTLIHIETADGRDILTFAPSKSYQSVVLCSAELQNGATYVVYTGGSSTGTATNGLYAGGTYSAGSENSTFTISSMVTTVGSAGNMPGGNMPGGFPGARP